MELSPDEKSNIFDRLSKLEDGQTGLRTTIAVTGSLLGVFLILSMAVGGWWLNYNFAKFDGMVNQVIVQGAKGEYLENQLANHTGDARNHPDNTERVNTVIRDVMKIEEQQQQLQRTMSRQYEQIIGMLNEMRSGGTGSD